MYKLIKSEPYGAYAIKRPDGTLMPKSNGNPAKYTLPTGIDICKELNRACVPKSGWELLAEVLGK